MVQDLMKKLMSSDNKKKTTEKRWEVISENMLRKYNIERSPGSIKNYWNRKGRQTSGLDERRVQRPDKMITGAQSSEARKQARQKGKRPAEDLAENEQEFDEEDEDEEAHKKDDDDESSDGSSKPPPSKRRKVESAQPVEA